MTSRIDTFIVWNHGLPYIADIMQTLRSNFEIIAIFRKDVNNIEKFVEDVYSCDSYPMSHLRDKTRYLLNTGKEVVLVLVRNNRVNEVLVGKGKFRKPQCLHIKEVKDKIRAKYNPELNNHVIHGTDYEDQVPELLKLFTNKGVNYYVKNNDPFPFHIKKQRYKACINHVNSLYCNLISDLVKVSETPHYRYAIGDKKPYIDYFYTNYGKELIEDHFPEKFDELLKVENFDPILVKDKLIIDGVHRASIYLSRNRDLIDCYDVL